MGNSYRNIFVHSVDQDRLVSAVKALGVSAYIFKGADWSVLIPKIKFDDEFWLRQQTLARDCSAAAQCSVLSFAVHDSSILLAELWRNGQWCGGYASSEDVDEPAFCGLTPAVLATTFGVTDRAACERVLERKKKSNRSLELALAALTEKYRDRWGTPEFREQFNNLAKEAIEAAIDVGATLPFGSADEQHLAICEVLRLPADAVGVDFADVANGEANLVATLVKAKRPPRAKA
jgi:hypothetical protein